MSVDERIQTGAFRLDGLGPVSPGTHRDAVAPRSAAPPGLPGKGRPADPETGTYGGVRAWPPGALPAIAPRDSWTP